MSTAWKAAGLTYNRYLAVAARVVRRSLKEGPRLQAERRGEMELRFAKWELVKDEYFTLFESVAALEIMDPKMDSGHLEPGETLEEHYDVLRVLLPEEVIGIMDQLLGFEMAWHMGSPLSQTLFTSHYLDRMLWPEPKTLEDARFERNQTPGPGNKLLHLVLRAYCLGLIKTCDFVHRKISSEHYYEEEDFVANLYNRNLLTNFEATDIINKIDDAIADMRVLGTMSFKQLLFDDLDELVLPADPLLDSTNADIEAPQDPRFQAAKKMDSFVLRAADPYLDIFRTLCMNRSRLRRMLTHLVLEWDSIQFEAEGVDTELRDFTEEKPMQDSQASIEEVWAFPLSSWAYYHKLRQMEWIVQMGFELGIYQVDELAGMYWYLQHLASTRIQHLERIRTFTLRRIKQIAEPSVKEKTAFRRSISFLEFAMLEASATQSFADGLSYIGESDKSYHSWWVVPRISTK
ncbi:N-alpha-acetyltransferase 35, NatC auxiliary subunit, partial [Lecanoromycetidae sp. Uapishka_2]